MGHATVSCAETAEPINMPFWTKTRVFPRNHVLDGDHADHPTGTGMQLKPHSVCQASTSRNPKNSERSDEWGDGVHSAGEV